MAALREALRSADREVGQTGNPYEPLGGLVGGLLHMDGRDVAAALRVPCRPAGALRAIPLVALLQTSARPTGEPIVMLPLPDNRSSQLEGMAPRLSLEVQRVQGLPRPLARGKQNASQGSGVE